jgi:hypothetical protein
VDRDITAPVSARSAIGPAREIDHRMKRNLFLALLSLPLAMGAYCGACLFAGQVDGTNQALLVGAELEFTTGFTGTKQ